MASPARKSEERPERVAHRAAQKDFRWDGVEMRPYKEDERALYKTITRQVLFSDPNMAGASVTRPKRAARSPRRRSANGTG